MAASLIDDRDVYRYRFNSVWTCLNFRAGILANPHRLISKFLNTEKRATYRQGYWSSRTLAPTDTLVNIEI
jgi:hypothetical protein